MEILIVGDGLAAQWVIYEIGKKYPNSEITVVSTKRFPPCQSTALAACRGARSGTEQGDLLIRGFQHLKKIYQNENVEGMYLSYLWSFYRNAHYKKNFESRYDKNWESNLPKPFMAQKHSVKEDCFLFNVDVFLKSLNKNNPCKIERIDDFIESIGSELIGQSGRKYKADKVIYCPGVYGNFHNFKSSPAAGCYLSWDKNWGEESFAFNFERHILIYRAFEKRIYLGVSDDEGYFLGINEDELKAKREIFQEICNEDLPQMHEAKFYSGIRAKGISKRPIWKETQENHFLITNLYKSGLLLAPIAAKDVVSLL